MPLPRSQGPLGHGNASSFILYVLLTVDLVAEARLKDAFHPIQHLQRAPLYVTYIVHARYELVNQPNFQETRQFE